MKFEVLVYTSSVKEEWLDDIYVDTLEELEEEVETLSRKYRTKVEVDFMTRIIFVGDQAWYDEHTY